MARLDYRRLTTMTARSISSGGTMIKRLNANIIIALCASCGIVAFAFYERYEAVDRVPAVVFYITATVICLLPVFYALVRHKNCKN
jgi:hypothetical protein